MVIRPYTPVTSDKSDKGYVDFVVKVSIPYACFSRYSLIAAINMEGQWQDYPGKGVMSSHFHSMKPGDELEVILGISLQGFLSLSYSLSNSRTDKRSHPQDRV